VEDKVENVGVLVVVVGNERYALGLGHVLGIDNSTEPTPVPGVPGFWLGLVNVHGTLYPVLDLREYLGIAPTPVDERRKLVLVRGAGLEVGLLVDEASDVTWIRRDAIGPPPNVSRGRRVIEGVTAEMVAMLDVEALLADPVLVVDDEAL
jgi:purine-binding chemotaxis protein CheW